VQAAALLLRTVAPRRRVILCAYGSGSRPGVPCSIGSRRPVCPCPALGWRDPSSFSPGEAMLSRLAPCSQVPEGRHLFTTFGDNPDTSGECRAAPGTSRRTRSGADAHGAGVERMQPLDFLFLTDGRLFIRHADGEIVEAEASSGRHAASLLLVLEEIATMDPIRGLELPPPVQS